MLYGGKSRNNTQFLPDPNNKHPLSQLRHTKPYSIKKCVPDFIPHVAGCNSNLFRDIPSRKLANLPNVLHDKCYWLQSSNVMKVVKVVTGTFILTMSIILPGQAP